jgi:hypothetical protein
MGHMLLFNAVLMVLCTLYYNPFRYPIVDQAIHDDGTFQYNVSGIKTS